MKKRYILFLAVLLMCGVNVITVSEYLKPTEIQPVMAVLNISRQPTKSLSSSADVFTTAPYAMRILVPKPIDSQMIVSMDDALSFKMPCIKPELRFEKQ